METTSLGAALKRGAFHAAMGVAIAAAVLLAPRVPLLVILSAGTVIFVALDIARLRTPALNSQFSARFAPLMRQKEYNRLTGSSYFLIGSLIAALAFPAYTAAAAILFLSLGDSAATAIGLWRGRTRLRGKSLEGHLACFTVCLAVGGVFWGLSYLPLPAAVAGAAAATLLEALPLAINDNVAIPVGSGLVMALVSLAGA